MTNAELLKMELSDIEGSSSNIEQILPQSNTHQKDKNVDQFQKGWFLTCATSIFLVYEIICLLVYLKVYSDPTYNKNKINWQNNFEEKCHKVMNKYDGILNGVYQACGYIGFGYGAYVFTLYRKTILKRTHMPI